ncbi:hypothetical protein [Natronorubrum thiooxidans]|uniref:hypothetical protein n=1 Tax=Natronorubrum thiooxidans TaxID=308853 RepID=UPI001C1FB328|nr:hypothetical protein [Natronorubrum thiooxidans]
MFALAFDGQHRVLENGPTDMELFEYVSGGDNTRLALSHASIRPNQFGFRDLPTPAVA